MKFGFRTPSLKKRIAARTSWKRIVRHSLGRKAPRGYGWLTNPKKAAYNRIYSRVTANRAAQVAKEEAAAKLKLLTSKEAAEYANKRIQSYYRKDGTYVAPHTRSAPHKHR